MTSEKGPEVAEGAIKGKDSVYGVVVVVCKERWVSGS